MAVKPVTCEICGTALSAKQALEQHMRIHTGETPWICKFPGCTCSFKQQSALTMHERTHTGDKPECHLCGKDFHRLDQLRRHMGTSHKDRPDEVNAWMNRSQSKTKPPQTHKMTRPIEPSPSDDLKPRDTPPNSNPLKRKLQKRSR